MVSLTLLERYSVLNKLSPGLKLRYSDSATPLSYKAEQEVTMQELIGNVCTSFQRLEQGVLCLTETLSYPMIDIYDDKIGL